MRYGSVPRGKVSERGANMYRPKCVVAYCYDTGGWVMSDLNNS